MTRLLVLGLLDERPLSGYDIGQMISKADAERWGGVLAGSIYHALKKLEQENYIELTSVEQTGHRQKAVYKITHQGKAHLQALVADSLRASSVTYPTTLYSGLSLLHKLPRNEARQALQEQKALLEQEYKALEQGQKTNEAAAQEVPLLSRLTIEHMFAVLQQQQQFVENILEALGQEGK